MNAPNLPPLDDAVLPTGIRSRFVDGVNGLRMHLLEAGHEDSGRPCLLLLHGFPELAYSWRKVMPDLAKAGYHVVAPDLRGYGRTAAGPVAYEADLAPFRTHNLLLDLLCLIAALGRERVAAVIGHDFGSWVAGYCALARPEFGVEARQGAGPTQEIMNQRVDGDHPCPGRHPAFPVRVGAEQEVGQHHRPELRSYAVDFPEGIENGLSHERTTLGCPRVGIGLGETRIDPTDEVAAADIANEQGEAVGCLIQRSLPQPRKG
jgi:pimeloyl-ACP methyl ester carboxylesterase